MRKVWEGKNRLQRALGPTQVREPQNPHLGVFLEQRSYRNPCVSMDLAPTEDHLSCTLTAPSKPNL